MKNNLKTIGKAILIISTGILACVLLFYLIDRIGIVADLLESRYIISHVYPSEEFLDRNGYVTQYTYNLWRVKKDLFFLLIASTTFWLLLICLFTVLTNRRTKKKLTFDISHMINTYIHHDIDASSVFTDAYAPIAAEMAEIKADISLKEQTLKEEVSRKNDLIMYLAHDLKTPLASVIGYLNLLRDETLISPEIREKYLSITLSKAEHLDELINEFFEIARFNLSTITLQLSKINLTRLLEQTVYEFEPMFHAKNLHCKLDMDDDIMLQCDADKIARVFDNLLRNAVIYSYRDTEIIINVVQGSDIKISFSNHGDTIPEEKLNRIFEQFYRLDASRSTENGSAGLGLAIAKQIIELHHGNICAASSKNRIHFIVTLPLS